jgi:hypothetical protein
MIRFFRKLFEFDVPHAYSNRRNISEADVIWTMTEGEAFAIALLFCLRLIPKRPIVANAIWMPNSWKYIPTWRRYIYRWSIEVHKCHDSTLGSVPSGLAGSLAYIEIAIVVFWGQHKDVFAASYPRALERWSN